MTCKDTTTPSTDAEPAPQSCGDDPLGLAQIPDLLRRSPGDTKPAFTYHQDPGHGWLEVPAVDLAANGLTEAAFSRYSYVDWDKMDGPVYFLEEDCDLPLFALAYANRHFKRPPMTEVYHAGDCFIRDLERIGEVAS